MDNERKLYNAGAITDFIGVAVFIAYIAVFFTAVLATIASMGDSANTVGGGLAVGFAGVVIVALGVISSVFLSLLTVVYTVLAIVNAVKMKNANYTRKCVAPIIFSAIITVVAVFFAVLLSAKFISAVFAAAACVLVLVAQIVIAIKIKSLKSV